MDLEACTEHYFFQYQMNAIANSNLSSYHFSMAL